MEKLLKSSDLKDGMRVIQKMTDYNGVIVKFKGAYYFCQNDIVSIGGVPDELKRGYAYSYPILENPITHELLNLNLLKKDKNIDKLETGDTVVGIDGTEYYVEQISPSVFVFIKNKGNDQLEATSIYLTINELKRNGYKLKGEEQGEADIIEMSLAEVAKMRGVPVEKLRIKDQ